MKFCEALSNMLQLECVSVSLRVSKSDVEIIKATFELKHKIRYNPFADTSWNDRWNDWFNCLTLDSLITVYELVCVCSDSQG